MSWMGKSTGMALHKLLYRPLSNPLKSFLVTSPKLSELAVWTVFDSYLSDLDNFVDFAITKLNLI